MPALWRVWGLSSAGVQGPNGSSASAEGDSTSFRHTAFASSMLLAIAASWGQNLLAWRQNS